MRLPEMQNSLAHEASPEQQDVHFDQLKTKVCIQAEQITQWSGLYERKDRPVNSLEAPGGVGNAVPATNHHQDGTWGDEHGDLLYNGRKGGKDISDCRHVYIRNDEWRLASSLSDNHTLYKNKFFLHPSA